MSARRALTLRRRRLLILTGAVVLVGVAGFFLLTWPARPTPGVTWENYRRLRKGMSSSDVEALLGKPFWVRDYDEVTFRSWRGEGVEITLLFEADGLACGDAMSPDLDGGPDADSQIEKIRPETFLGCIRRWLHLGRRPRPWFGSLLVRW